jgi:hypothetical protein
MVLIEHRKVVPPKIGPWAYIWSKF